MKLLTSVLFSLFFLSSPVLAAEYPDGDISFHNASNKTITAQVSPMGKFNLAANENKSVSYSTLSRVCPAVKCTAQFYANNVPAGSATIDTETGKLVNMNMRMKIQTAKGSQQVLRSIVIQ